MEIVFKENNKTVMFNNLRPGEFFTKPNTRGLYMKVEPGSMIPKHHDVVILQASMDKDAISAGRSTYWSDDSWVIPVTKITIEI